LAFKLGLDEFDVPIIRRKEKVGWEPIPFFPHAHVHFVLWCKFKCFCEAHMIQIPPNVH
jgi:hypothetical protein